MSNDINTHTTTTAIVTAGVVGVALIYVLFGSKMISSKGNKNNEKEDKEEVEDNYSEPPSDSRFKLIYNSKYKIRYTDDYTDATDDDSKTTLIFVHGFLGCLETWNPMKQLLLSSSKENTKQRSMRIITLDLLGSGFSSKPGLEDDSEEDEINNINFDYTFESQGKALAEFIIEMDLLDDKNKLILIGHSAGCVSLCTTASELLLKKHRIVVDGMVMIGPGFFQYKPSLLSNPWFGWLSRFLAKQLNKGGTSMLKSKSCHLNIENLTPEILEAFENARNSQYSSQVMEKFVTCQESKSSYDKFLEDIPPVDVRVHMVWSKSDTINPPNVEKVNNVLLGSNNIKITHKVYEI